MSATKVDIVSAAAPASATELNRTFTSRMSYFDNGLLKQAVQPSTAGFGTVNEVLNYTYDDLDRPRTLTGAGAIVADTIYTPFGEVAQRVLGPSIGRSIYDTFEYADDTRRLDRHWATKQTAADTLNRPGMSGESFRWKDDDHGTSLEVSGAVQLGRVRI